VRFVDFQILKLSCQSVHVLTAVAPPGFVYPVQKDHLSIPSLCVSHTGLAMVAR